MKTLLGSAAAAALTAAALCGCGRIVPKASYISDNAPDNAAAEPPAYSVTAMMYRMEEGGDADGTPKARTVTLYSARDDVLSYENTDLTSGRTNTVNHRYEYSDSGTLLSVYTSEPESLIEYEYDSKGRVSAESYTAAGSIPSVKRYTYDSRGNVLTADIEKAGSISPLSRYDYTYDSRGNITAERELDADSGEVLREKMMTYDSAGQLTEETDRDMSVPGMTVINYTYDTGGNTVCIDTRYIDGEGNTVRTLSEEREYDEKDRIIREEYSCDGALSWFEVYMYEEF